MPDITMGTTLVVSKDLLSESLYATNVTATMSQSGFKSTTYTVNSALTSLSTANIQTVGVAVFRNISTGTAATIALSVTTGTSTISFSTLRAGEPGMMRLSAGVNYVASGTAGAILRVDITEG